MNKEHIRSKIVELKEKREYDAMVRMGDLSFGNYTPTQIYVKALNDVLALLTKEDNGV